MKIDRLLGILIYLLNSKTASARELAEKFEVSTRTIRRDINSLIQAGIPLYAEQGSGGGYGVVEAYTLDRQIINPDDYNFITSALKILSSACSSRDLSRTMDKIQSLKTDRDHTFGEDELYIDFAGFKYPGIIEDQFQVIKKALDQQIVIQFDYASSSFEKNHYTVEPLSMVFKWHSWDLLGFNRDKSCYRLFNISRIRNVELLAETFNKGSFTPADYFARQKQTQENNLIDLKLQFHEDLQVNVEEYFGDGEYSRLADGSMLMEITLPFDEQHLTGIIISFGDRVKILQPTFLKDKILEKLEKILRSYRD